jgi:tRNA-splicing ligase RtcB
LKGRGMKLLAKEKYPVLGWTDGVPVDEKALAQLRNMASMPFVHKHIAVMPDVHWGMGATVGSVIPTIGAIIPAAVGVDIGCGMMAVKTNITASHLPDNLSTIRSKIESAIPHGRTDNGSVNDSGAHREAKNISIIDRLKSIVEKHPDLERAAERAPFHLGTLGTGNHFIELCLDAEGNLWVMLHSGSRGIGNKIGTYFIEKAKEDMRRWFINLPDADLAYIPEGSKLFDDYMEALSWAQEFAMLNRHHMMDVVCKILSQEFEGFQTTEMAVNCHHNYVTKENHYGKNVWLTRKGAVRAREGDLGIIPGSMGARSYIVRGKGNKESFCSCSHGAGRTMSRGEAMKKITLEQHAIDTSGVECKKDSSVLDESPSAYKDIDSVIAAQSDLIDVVAILKQIVCVKG